MKKILILFLLVFSPVTNCFCQNLQLKGKILEKDSHKAIEGVYVFESTDHYTGTISNKDGYFVLNMQKKTDSLIFSHINYENLSVKLGNNSFLEIFLSPKTYEITEITVKPIVTRKIIDKVIENLEKNHAVEPVYYNYFTRIVSFSTDSTIDFLEEHAGKILQKKNHNTNIKLEKSRFKFFTKKGEEHYKSYRMISMTSMVLDNLFKLRDDYLHPRKSKNYNYKLLREEKVFDKNCFVIEFTTDKATYYKKGQLFIDKATFAIVKKTLDAGCDTEEVNFVEINGRWYHKSTNNLMCRDDYFQNRITLYNKIDKPVSDDGFVLTAAVLGKKIKKFRGDFHDMFWENHDFIPLPNWIKEDIDKGNSR